MRMRCGGRSGLSGFRCASGRRGRGCRADLARVRGWGWDALWGEWGGVVVRAVRGDEMAQQKRGLGRGLGALIPTAPGPVMPGSRGGDPGDAAVAGSAAAAREQ